ncbi:MAG: HD domain-containing protein [Deltaproteobacteria bacterium]|nr:HD domain-containing protein [Deltaproteobacteria bacterium]
MLLAKARELVRSHVKSDNLLRHLLQVAQCMNYYANFFHQNNEEWVVTGLVHDLDYDTTKHTNPPDGHPYLGVSILKNNGFSESIIEAVLGHADYTNVQRVTQLAKCLYAVDELSGFLNACSRVHPSRNFADLTFDFVMKRFNEKSFSKGISRDVLLRGAEELEVDFRQHVENCINALCSDIWFWP